MRVDETPITGTVLEIQRLSTEDGPGIRTTVFMKGCPMHCLWCHNPESISPLPQTQWIGSRCIGCKTCLDACPNGALSDPATGLTIDRSRCKGCGTCVEACPGGALELLGRQWEVDALARELLKDREYFKQSAGGTTVSGGEATLQWRFVSALLKDLKQQGVHTAIDTCGIVNREALEAILPYTDLILYDLNEMDPHLHREFTHCPIDPVLENLVFLCQYIRSHDVPGEIWVRTPLIPGATARQDNVARIGAFLAANCQGAVTRWDLLTFNNLCKDKYLRLGLDWQFKDTALLSQESLEALGQAALRSGVAPAIVQWSGATRLEVESDEESQPDRQHPRVRVGCA